MEAAAASEDCCVKVAVHVRPLVGDEKLQGCKDCVTVISGKPRVQIGSHSFTFDHVHGSTSSPSSSMFEECIVSLVDGLFQGYNATVLAYGQTGSGKTYTMGTCFKDGYQIGVIPQVMNALFLKIESLKHETEFQLHVSFIEILKEEVRDLLDPTSLNKSDSASPNGKVHLPGKSPIQIRESSNGVITVAGSTEVSVCTLKDMAACLEQGSSSRATGIIEPLQLRKEGRRNEYERHKLQALNQRQKMVLQRKTEETAMATKRLKELLEARNSSPRDNSAIANGYGTNGQTNGKVLQSWLNRSGLESSGSRVRSLRESKDY